MTNAPDSTRPMRPSKKQPPPVPGTSRAPADQPPPSASATIPIRPEDIIVVEIEK
jgi:hypothetical protein